MGKNVHTYLKNHDSTPQLFNKLCMEHKAMVLKKATDFELTNCKSLGYA